MRFLLLETQPHGADAVVAMLTAAGHDTARCHDPDAGVFPCAAVRGEPCPVEGASVDAAITVRSFASPDPAPAEDGVSCALRHHVPVVVTGATDGNPFEAYAFADVALGEVLATCERAGSAPNASLTAAADAELADISRRQGLSDDAGSATVHRHAGDLRVELDLTDAALDFGAAAAVKVAGRLRQIDRNAGRIDVSLASHPRWP